MKKTGYKAANPEDRMREDASARIKRSFLIRHLWIYPVCAGSVYLLSNAFLPIKPIRVLLSLVLSVFPFLSVVRLLYGKRNALLRSQSKVLLQSLCTSVSGGYSLESAFLAARPTLEKAFGRRCLMAQALVRLEKSLSAHVPLSDTLSELCCRLDYMELMPIMKALSITRVVGNGVISILRNSCQMLSELMAVSSEVDANNAGRNTEAFILCLMPFGITFTLSAFTNGYMDSAGKSPLGILLMLLAFSIAIVSCGFLLTLIGSGNKIQKGTSPDSGNPYRIFHRVSGRIREFITRFFPESYTTRQYERFSELSCDPETLYEMEISKALALVLLVTPLTFAFLLLSGYPVYLAFFAAFTVIIMTHYETSQRVSRRRELLMEEIPLFLSMLVTLLQSGVLLPKAIETCAGAFPENSTLGYEIRIMKAQMLSGLSAGRAIENFSVRTPIPEAQAALLLISRYELTGGAEVLQLLALQANACWSLCRNASRKKRERDALAMVLPMMLDLISVLLVAITPALMSLKISN